MNNIEIFKSEQFGQVRTTSIDGEPWFVGKDVAIILGYSNPRKALGDHVDPEDKSDGVTIRDSIGRDQNPTIINESGLYSLILSSKLPTAKAFKRWITSEVIPAIRKTGGYLGDTKGMSDMEIMAKALQIADRSIKEKDKLIEEMTPKALFADAVAASDGTCLVGELAKMITQAGYPIGQNRLFKYLRDNGYLGKSGSNYNVPLQKYVEDMKLFVIKETAITHADGHVTINRTPKVTGRGQRYFIKKFQDMMGEEATA